MIDNELEIKKQESVSYPPLPNDVYQVELLDINTKVHPKYMKPDEKEQVFDFQFVVLEDGEFRARNLWAGYIKTYLYIGKNGKNSLYQVLEAMLGRELTEEEEANGITGKLLNDLIGKQCRLGTEIVVKGEKQYNKITQFLRAKKNLTPLTDDEKEKCKVKNKKVETEESKMPDVSDIPF